MAKKKFFGAIGDFFSGLFGRKSKKLAETAVETTVEVVEDVADAAVGLAEGLVEGLDSLFSSDKEDRRKKQRKLRAKRRQLELKAQRTEYQAIKHDRSLPPSQRAKRYQDYLRRYGKQKAPYPGGETREFWMRFREAGGS